MATARSAFQALACTLKADAQTLGVKGKGVKGQRERRAVGVLKESFELPQADEVLRVRMGPEQRGHSNTPTDPILAADIAVQTQETMCQHPALPKRPQPAFDKSWHRAIAAGLLFRKVVPPAQ
jgi:hypothetical protein